jgi:hypothetical protein
MIVLAMLARAKGGEGVKSGPIGLAVILVLCVAAYFLFKSMSKHLKRVRDDFPADPATVAPSDPPAPEAAAPQTVEELAATDDSDHPTEAPPRSDAAP